MLFCRLAASFNKRVVGTFHRCASNAAHSKRYVLQPYRDLATEPNFVMTNRREKKRKDRHKQVSKAVFCPYCQKPAELLDDTIVYKRLHGKIWICQDCDAYVGTHKNSENHAPLGTLANAKLRELRKFAHWNFDPIWKAKMKRDNVEQSKARSLGYGWLAKEMALDVAKCHIAMFDEEQCEIAIEICKPYKERLKKHATT